MTPNKFKSIIVAVSLIVGFVGLALQFSGSDAWLLLMGFSLAYITALTMLIQNGRFIHTGHFRKVQFCVSIAIIGALFRLMHWPYGSALTGFGLMAIASFYTVWFFKKKEKRLLDMLKVLWVIAICLYATSRVFHLLKPQWIHVPTTLFWLMFIVYTYQEFRKQNRLKSYLTHAGIDKEKLKADDSDNAD